MLDQPSAGFVTRVSDRGATVAIVGLGDVESPLATAFASAGVTTIGLDVDATRVDARRAGCGHIDDVTDTMLATAAHFAATPTSGTHERR
jgi:UDP-N-acetyl-D-glucosamine dehydrogenase